MQLSILIGCAVTVLTVNAIVLPTSFYVGIYDKAALAKLGPGEKAAPGWILCHPRAGTRWGLYAADLDTDCDFESDGPEANLWSFGLPGTKPLEEDETFRAVFLAGSGSDKASGKPEGLTATFDMGIVNTYFSYGYTDGLYRSAPFNVVRDGQVLTMERDDQPRPGDVLDFLGVAGKPDDQKVLRLQTFSGVDTKYWNIGRGLALPVSAGVPAVEFRILSVLDQEIEETIVSYNKESPYYEEEEDYRAYEDMVPKQGTLGALASAGRGFLGKFAKSIGNKLTGGKTTAVKEETKEDYVEPVQPNNARFQSFEMDYSTQNRKNQNNGL
ncbi:hypothetical protein TWF696_003648 [Orbilia brochopaga]|uniref:Uncharacterized protein n=1 Tax=Orbilia brochopaga TaxID=3140254 RepID=A0AAV9V642_9PEZI